MIKIKRTDITQNVNESSYKINEECLYDEWTDANGTGHRTITRSKVKGSLVLIFVEGYGIAFDEFCRLVNEAKNGLTLPLTLSINNTGETKTIEAFYKLNADPPRRINSGHVFRKVTMTIEER